MSILLLRLAGPLQSWGVESRFLRRGTHSAPTKSGVIGLLAAAQGRRRTDEIDDLLPLTMAARIDQPGHLLRDFHTAKHSVTDVSMPLSERFYRSDAVFTAYVCGPDPLIATLADAMHDPAFPLYLGRRACVPTHPLLVAVVEGEDVAAVVAATPWQASRAYRRKLQSPRVTLAVQADAVIYPELVAQRELCDVPISYDPCLRQYQSRMVVDTSVTVDHPDVSAKSSSLHDPMDLLGAPS